MYLIIIVLYVTQEPTSGLDYKTAFSLVKTLKHYTEERNKTVVATIHQPSSQIFYFFDLLLLACDGNVRKHSVSLYVILSQQHHEKTEYL